jgi:AGCS family alanine or glycine:cation symporter
MSKPAIKALKDYEAQQKSGVTEYTFDPKKLGIKNADFWEERIEKNKAPVSDQVKS